mmetsp:Transcript_21211/g.48154  ORF Transcript_21211/g.48154 Transcript_21211/m.48154 type:complete len:108 (-) Transcript_21211:464-787(-)
MLKTCRWQWECDIFGRQLQVSDIQMIKIKNMAFSKKNNFITFSSPIPILEPCTQISMVPFLLKKMKLEDFVFILKYDNDNIRDYYLSGRTFYPASKVFIVTLQRNLS